MTKKKTKQVATTEKAGAVATTEGNQDLAAMYDDDQADDFNQKDLLISRILLAQSQSEYVQDEKAKAGQLVGSLEHDLVAKLGDTVEVIPFHRNKTYRLFKPQPGGGTPKFIAEVPYDADTKAWEDRRLREVEWTYKDLDGKEVTETLSCFITWNYYVLLTDDVESLPRVVSFSSTSFKIGKKLGTFTLEAKKQGKPLPFKTYLIGAEATKNDKGNFFTFTAAKGRDTTDAELTHVKAWADLAKKGEIKVDAAVDATESDSATMNAPPVEEGKVEAGAQY